MRRRGHQAGFTMVELMIALVVSALLVGMILSIFTRMSTAYRTQAHVAELQQVLTAAQDTIQRDLRQAGFQLPDGFRVKGPPGVHWAVEIIDDADGFGPDELHLFYADPSAQAQIVDYNSRRPEDAFTSFEVDAVDNFDPGDIVVITTNYLTRDVGTAPDLERFPLFEACVVQVDQIIGTTFSVRTAGDWGDADNDACDRVRPHTTPAMVYRFKARGYRIDPTRRSLAVLQVSPSGGLVRGDWQDLGIGFTDLQLASRWYEEEDDVDTTRRLTDTADVDIDPLRDWYSGAEQEVRSGFWPLTTFADPPLTTRSLLMEVRVSLAARTTRRLDTVGASLTPGFIDAARPDNNDLGNRGPVTLAGVADGSRPEELRGDHLYRYATVGSDTRNLAVGR